MKLCSLLLRAYIIFSINISPLSCKNAKRVRLYIWYTFFFIIIMFIFTENPVKWDTRVVFCRFLFAHETIEKQCDQINMWRSANSIIFLLFKPASIQILSIELKYYKLHLQNPKRNWKITKKYFSNNNYNFN